MINPLDQTVSPPALGAAQSQAGWAQGSRRRFFLRPRIIAIAAVMLFAVAYGAYEAYLRFTHVYEYDARATADIVTISSRAEGWVVEMPAREGMRVDAGQVVVRIDDRIAKLRVDSLKAQIEGVRVERSRLKAERVLDREQVEAAMRTRTSGVTVREKARQALQSDLDFAKLELDRAKALFATRVINERQLQTAQAAVTKLEFQVLQMRAEHDQAEAASTRRAPARKSSR
jgi:membrane fusion protein (multidrug efflux system)